MENITEKEIFEASLNNLKLEKTGERFIIGKIIASWTMKTMFCRYKINLEDISAFIKLNGALESKATEGALNSAESFAKSILVRSLERLKRMIEKKKKGGIF